MDDLSDQGVLEEYRREIERLREENRYLRQSSQTFGELAERLRVRLARADGEIAAPAPTDER